MRKKRFLVLGLIAVMGLTACSKESEVAVISNQTAAETTLEETTQGTTIEQGTTEEEITIEETTEQEGTLSSIQSDKETDIQDESTEAVDSNGYSDNPGEAILTSGMSVSDYIAGVQISREQVRAKNKDTLLSIINNNSIDEAAKQQAIQDMLNLTVIAEKENAAETLLLAKGFSDPVVSIGSDKVDVVINAPNITNEQREQIEDIVKRKAEVEAENIVITLLNLAE